jgi:uncharacterized metal-binding protein YceD (DUF177 family)
MNSRASGSSTYRSLAQQRAEVNRVLKMDSMQRLNGLCSGGSTFATRVEFDQDDEGRVVCRGSVSGDISLGCHRCDEQVERHLASTFEAVIAFDEDQAEQWQRQGLGKDIIVVQSPNLDVTELVEDELILAIPERVCLEEDCSNRPAMSYGKDEDTVDDPRVNAEAETRRPFAGLKQALAEFGEADREGKT